MKRFIVLACFFLTTQISQSLYAQNIFGTVNSYAAVNAVTPNSATLAAIGPFQVGDKVLIIQMKGALITATNTAGFGTITNLGNAGNFEATAETGRL